MADTSVAAVVDYLLVVASSINGVTVLDGDDGTRPTTDVIAVGYGLPDHIVVTTSRPHGFGLSLETVDVSCSLWSWSASPNYAVLRRRCQDLLDQFTTIIDQDPQLGGVCDTASLGLGSTWRQEVVGTDYFVTVTFTVEAKRTS